MNIATSDQPTPPTPTIPPPTFQLLNGSLVEAADGRAKVRFVPGPETANPVGRVQGGILAACVDDTMGPAVFSLGRDGFFVTVALSVSFVGSAEPGQAIVGEAKVVRAGKRHLLVEACLVREIDGTEVVRGSATCLLRSEEP